MNDH